MENDSNAAHVLSDRFVDETLCAVKDRLFTYVRPERHTVRNGSVRVLILCIIRSEMLVRLFGVLCWIVFYYCVYLVHYNIHLCYCYASVV
jgi:hypothetical protein